MTYCKCVQYLRFCFKCLHCSIIFSDVSNVPTGRSWTLIELNDDRRLPSHVLDHQLKYRCNAMFLGSRNDLNHAICYATHLKFRDSNVKINKVTFFTLTIGDDPYVSLLPEQAMTNSSEISGLARLSA